MPGSDGQSTLHGRVNENALSLAREWRRLGRAASIVALFTSPLLFVLLHDGAEWAFPWALLGTIVGVVAFRGLVDVIAHKLIPAPSLYGAEAELKEYDVVSRRRLWYWRKKYRRLTWLFLFFSIAVAVAMIVNSFSGREASIASAVSDIAHLVVVFLPYALAQSPILALFFVFNFVILIGPMLFLGIQQIKGYEPGDADWGVKLDDVRGQVEAKEEITRVVTLWQSGEEFEKAGGKRERGVLFLGAPGTGKTMLSKAIATSFNCPFVTIPGSGFQQMFMGLDAVIVRFLARKAKKLAAKWGGQCIVFIDEIDAVGMRRQSLGSSFQPVSENTRPYFGQWGARTPDGDLFLETAEWREHLFTQRAEPPGAIYPAVYQRAASAINNFMIPGMGGMGGSGLALNQLLVVMDGISDPPFTKRFTTNRLNTFLDALYFMPRRIGKLSLRLSPPRPRKEEIYFIGACNVPLQQLDPALTRPGRMGRHIYFRTPTWEDRRDIFDLYLAKVAHDPALDTPEKRDELARITNGYSPAMIDQVCSMALTYAHSDGRQAFEWPDIVESMTTVESGVAIRQPYPKHEARAVAIHEAGHAVCSHLYGENKLSTRLSIRRRGSSGGHHQAMEIEDRFADWRSEQVAELIWGLGAMAAEYVFYGQNTTGVGGDVHGVTWDAARMVGRHAMGPARIELSDRIEDPEKRAEEEERLKDRTVKLGLQIMHRSGGGSLYESDGMSKVLEDPHKRTLVAGLLGQAFVVAYCTVRHNRAGTDQVAEELLRKGELYGHEVVELLESVHLSKPEIDVLDEATWPKI